MVKIEIKLWKYDKDLKNDIIKEGINNYRTMIFHLPKEVEEFELIKGDLREYFSEFQSLKEKLEDKDVAMVFVEKYDEESQKKIKSVLNENKLKYTEQEMDYPI